MMKKQILTLFLALVLPVSVLCGCSAKKTTSESEKQEIISSTEAVNTAADGFEELGGLWAPGAIYYEGKLIDLKDNESIASLYDSQYISIREDGSFEFLDYFGRRGTYSRYEKGKDGYISFLLHTDECFTTSYENGELVEIPNENSEKNTYLAEIPGDDPNTMILHKFDPLLGAPAADDDPIVYVKNECESSFIAKYKTPLG